MDEYANVICACVCLFAVYVLMVIMFAEIWVERMCEKFDGFLSRILLLYFGRNCERILTNAYRVDNRFPLFIILIYIAHFAYAPIKLTIHNAMNN